MANKLLQLDEDDVEFTDGPSKFARILQALQLNLDVREVYAMEDFGGQIARFTVASGRAGICLLHALRR